MTGSKKLSGIIAFALMLSLFSFQPQTQGPNELFAQTTSDDLIQDMKWRSIGPANMSGRISDIDVLDNDFTTMLIASASGGVFKSVNAGITFEPIFADYGAASIGDVAMFQKNPDIIWVGTGEECSRNSIAWGDGIYKSVDGGETFENVGLKDTHSIAKIITHPSNPDLVYAAAAGHLWGYSGDRGLYMTKNGGKTWDKLTNGLPDDGKTGAIDLVMDPKNSNTLYVGMWQRQRFPNKFDSGGPNGGIYKSTNGGKSWKKLTNGLPEGDLGKIGIAIYKKNPKILMAMVEHSFQPRNGDDGFDDLSQLGTGIYRSENGGKSWNLINRHNSRPFYYSHIYINPTDDKKVYVMDSAFYISEDKGKTLERQDTRIHGDHHAMWLDPNNGDRFIIGTDGGAAISHDHGKYYNFLDNLVFAQFYAIGVDMRDPYWVYGGLQDNGTWGGPTKVNDPNGILTDHWRKFNGGDGFFAQIDPTNWRNLYAESQAGNVSKIDALTHESEDIKPEKDNILNFDEYITEEILAAQFEKGFEDDGEGEPFRFNWSAPIHLSPHNPNTIYFGGNHLFKSVDQGSNWTIISPDLSKNDPIDTQRETGGITSDITGAETYGTIITVSESPITPGLVWVGTDDGNVQITQNNGRTWTDVTANIGSETSPFFVSRVEASHFEKGTAYVTYDGHRSDNFKPYVFVTTDFGTTWKNITGNIPDGNSMYVVKEDLKNPDLLFAGSEFGIFYSLDRGVKWDKLMNGLPTVAVHDIVIHPRDNDLVIGTHGRGIWVLDDITALQQLTSDVLESESFLFDQRDFTKWEEIQKSDPRKGHQVFYGDNYDASGAPITYYLSKDVEGDVLIEVTDLEGKKGEFLAENTKGIHVVKWGMRFDPDSSISDKQRGNIIDRLNEMVEEAKEEETKTDLKTRLEDFSNAKDHAHVAKALSGINLRRPNEWRSSLRAPQGKLAKPGQFMIKLKVGESEASILYTIKADPILKK